MSDEKTKYWDALKEPPPSALKEIKGGRLSGKTDISPQWRYRTMTEQFGPIGLGWKFTVDKMWTDAGADYQVFAFVNISLFVKFGDAWSDAIPGNGGHLLIVKERNGMHNNDEAFKMATTDALSAALKMLGVAADVYAGLKDSSFPDSKYAYNQLQEQKKEHRADPLQDQAMDLFDKHKNNMAPDQRQWCMDGLSAQYRNYQGVMDEINKTFPPQQGA